MENKITRKYNLKFKPSSHRLFQHHHFDNNIFLPKIIDLRNNFCIVYDQGKLGSCTANALAAAVSFEEKKDKNIDILPSRLFIYYNERSLNNTINEDSGAALSDGIIAIQKWGVCPENMWKYNDACLDNNGSKNTEGKYQFEITPSVECYKIASSYTVPTNACVNVNDGDLFGIKKILSDGHPVVFGALIFVTFEHLAKNAIIPIPNVISENCLGGHALLFVGYDDEKELFIVRNSWGSHWGDKGYCYLPYKYVSDKFNVDGSNSYLVTDMHAFYNINAPNIKLPNTSLNENETTDDISTKKT
jgi:C1A family cysteine protease